MYRCLCEVFSFYYVRWFSIHLSLHYCVYVVAFLFELLVNI